MISTFSWVHSLWNMFSFTFAESESTTQFLVKCNQDSVLLYKIYFHERNEWLYSLKWRIVSLVHLGLHHEQERTHSLYISYELLSFVGFDLWMYKSVIPLSVINKVSKFQTNLLLNKKKNNLKKFTE